MLTSLRKSVMALLLILGAHTANPQNARTIVFAGNANGCVVLYSVLFSLESALANCQNMQWFGVIIPDVNPREVFGDLYL